MKVLAGAEVDFIIDSGIDRQVPYEVKYKNLEREGSHEN